MKIETDHLTIAQREEYARQSDVITKGPYDAEHIGEALYLVEAGRLYCHSFGDIETMYNILTHREPEECRKIIEAWKLMHRGGKLISVQPEHPRNRASAGPESPYLPSPKPAKNQRPSGAARLETSEQTVNEEPNSEQGALNNQPDVQAREQIEIAYGKFKGVYEVYPVASMFPLSLTGKKNEDLEDSIRIHGQQEPIVIHEAKIVDGRRRIHALNRLGVEPRIIQFADLMTDLSIADWIIMKNLQHRHLTDDQYLAIVARYQEWCEVDAAHQQAEAKAKSNAGAKSKANDQDATGQDEDDEAAQESKASEYPPKSAENQPKRKRGRPKGGSRRKAQGLAKRTGASRYNAEQILKLRKLSPKLAVAVEKGHLTLQEAMKQLEKSQPPKASPKKAPTLETSVAWAEAQLQKKAEQLKPEDRSVFWEKVADIAKTKRGKG